MNNNNKDGGGGESNDGSPAKPPPGAAGGLSSLPAHFSAAALAGLAGHPPSTSGQFSFLDPTASLLAAVAASTMHQQLGVGNNNGGGGGHSQSHQANNISNTPGLPPNATPAQLAAARAALLGSGGGNAGLNVRTIAALLGSGPIPPGLGLAGAGGPVSNPAVSTTSASDLVRQALSQPTVSDTSSSAASTMPPSSKGKSTAGGGGGGGASSKRIHTSSSAASGSISSMLVPNMHAWDVQKLEQHVKLLHQMNQPVPQSVALLLADARRKEEKRAAKRIANRKSACTSRARKKALVEEMTKANARLRRQAMILSLLPDLVIAITPEGEITFCSGQVENCLQYKTDELLGANLTNLLLPASRGELSNVIENLMGNEKPSNEAEADRGTKRHLSANDQQASTDTNTNNSNGSSRSADQNSGSTEAAIVSEKSSDSFPLSVVKVESNQKDRKRPATGKAGDSLNGGSSSDNSTNNSSGKQRAVSSISNSANLSRSPTASSLGEDAGAPATKAAKRSATSGDDSSSLSSDAKNMSKANDNLDRNVRWHNERLMNDDKSVKLQKGPKDDVTGASVTANNATARLSSLQHVPEKTIEEEVAEPKPKRKKTSIYETGDQSSSDDSLLAGVEEKKKEEKANASDDSGYRESNDSREIEETSSSSSDTSNSNGLGRLAPTCKMCLIRDDMTTVWCEVTSSIRTKSMDEDLSDSTSQPGIGAKSETQSQSGKSSDGVKDVPAENKPEFKEILLCLRPIRDGEKLADESLRFIRPVKKSASPAPEGGDPMSTETNSSGQEKDQSTNSANSSLRGNSETSSGSSSQKMKKKPPKKRMLPLAKNAEARASKKAKMTRIEEPSTKETTDTAV